MVRGKLDVNLVAVAISSHRLLKAGPVAVVTIRNRFALHRSNVLVLLLPVIAELGDPVSAFGSAGASIHATVTSEKIGGLLAQLAPLEEVRRHRQRPLCNEDGELARLGSAEDGVDPGAET